MNPYPTIQELAAENKALRDEIEKLRKERGQLCTILAMVRATDGELESENAELLGIVRQVEWVEGWCPICGANKKSGAHDAGCKIKKAKGEDG